MESKKSHAMKALGSLALLVISGVMVLVGLPGVMDSKNHAGVPVGDAGVAAVGITLMGVAIGYLIGRPRAGAAVGLVLSSTAFIVWLVRSLMPALRDM